MGLRNFENLEDAVSEVRQHSEIGSPSNSILNNLKKELNRAFPDTNCTKIIYTENTDKLFFGACVYPLVDDIMTRKIVLEDEPVRIRDYILELDSKLFGVTLNLSDAELTAILMHEVGHMTNTSSPVEEVRKTLDIYMLRNDDHIEISKLLDYNICNIISYGIADTLMKITSVFYDKDEEFKADSFAIKNGYGKELESAMEKIYHKGYILNKDVNDKFIVLAWCLRLYKDVKLRRIAALRIINRAKSLTPSQSEKMALDKLANNLKFIQIKESAVNEGVISKSMFNVQIRGISGFESDLYEYRMLITNIDEQDEAILVMRQINARIAILEDLLTSENASESQRNKVDKLLTAFRELREQLAKKVTYKDRYVGVIVNYPAIKGLDY